MNGVIRTRVGYAGGTSDNPTYRMLEDHAEAFQVDYDPSLISYEELVGMFWEGHSPTIRPWSSQYRPAIFYHNEEQRRVAAASKEEIASNLSRRIITEIVPLKEFYLAEDYHQKHNLRTNPRFLDELTGIYPDVESLIASSAASRINGYLGGNGTCEQLQSEIKNLGLSVSGSNSLIETVCGRNAKMYCPTNRCN
jgi:methionine-S-sulfoxide reductase